MSVLRLRLRLQLHKAVTFSETHIPILNHGFYKLQAKPFSYTTVKYHLQTIKNSTLDQKSHKSEPDTLIYRDDPDCFGSLSGMNQTLKDEPEQEEGDKKEEHKISHYTPDYNKLSIKKYSDLIKEHLDNKRVKEALDILDVKMLVEDQVKPDSYIYNILISGCAQVGYTKKAFMLFNDMKKRGLEVTGGTYTSLFNACSNSPWPKDGASRAIQLKKLMEEKLHEPNLTNYNSMIKAFGRCGDLQSAFGTVDEMLSKKIKIRVHTFNFLLQACITDKVSGFRHALLVWRKMLAFREKPNLYTFNLMLRCIKECELGEDINMDHIGNLIPELSGEIQNNSRKMLNVGQLNDCNGTNAVSTSSDALCVRNTVDELPNLIAKTPHMGSVVSLKAIRNMNDRFMLVGGLDGFLREFELWGVEPDIKTVTQLLDVMPNTIEAEEKLLSKMKQHKVKVDIDFFNFLMRRRCLRFDYDAAKDVTKLIEEENKIIKQHYFKRKTVLKPNIMTYGILAMSCTTLEKTSEFLQDMKDKKFRINSEIMGTFMKNATHRKDFAFILYILNCTKEDDIVVNRMFIQHAEKFKEHCRTILKAIKNKPVKSAEEEDFIQQCRNFFTTYNSIKNVLKNNENVENEHPWTQFRKNQLETFQRPVLGKVKGIRYHKRPSRRHVKYDVKV